MRLRIILVIGLLLFGMAPVIAQEGGHSPTMAEAIDRELDGWTHGPQSYAPPGWIHGQGYGPPVGARSKPMPAAGQRELDGWAVSQGHRSLVQTQPTVAASRTSSGLDSQVPLGIAVPAVVLAALLAAAAATVLARHRHAPSV
jgi:hypothetical protein